MQSRSSAVTFSLLTLLAAPLFLSHAACGQSLTLNSGDSVTVTGAGTVGTIAGTPVANTTNSYGGEFAVQTNGDAVFTLGTGGSLMGGGDDAVTLDDEGGAANVTGGTITVGGPFGGTMLARGSGSLITLTGGTFSFTDPSDDDLSAYSGGNIALYGDFGLPLGTTENLSDPSGSFTGTLENDSVGQTFTYVTYAGGTITLHEGAVPEPSAAVLVMGGVGLLALAGRRRRFA